MGRTLYLNENSNINVTRDGPSVWIQWCSGSGQRVPARLISRVVIIGNVKLEAGAITLFTENDIPVVFLTKSGEEVAVALPYNHKLPTHYEEQKVFLETAENSQRFENWANTKRMVIQVSIMRRLYRKSSYKFKFGFGEGNYQKLLSPFKPRSEDKWTAVTNVINNLFRLLIIEHLIKAGLDLHMGVIHRRHNFGLALDICYIMGGESDLQAIKFFRCAKSDHIEKISGNWTLTDKGMRNIIQRFENRKVALHNIVSSIIDEIFELMRQLRT